MEKGDEAQEIARGKGGRWNQNGEKEYKKGTIICL